MMIHFDFLSEVIDLKEDQIKVLCIENPLLFRKIFSAFINCETEENNIIFSEDFIPFNPKGNICVIYDFFRLSYSNAVIKKLYGQIEKYCNNELSKETIQLKTHLVNFMETVTKHFDYDFDFNYDIDLIEVLKVMSLRPATDKRGLLNMLVDYIMILNKYVSPKCLVLLNLHLYFDTDELNLFYKDIINNHIKILVIEHKKFFDCSSYENAIIYDNDFCEIIE